MPQFHVKKGDEVVVISGAERGNRGKIISVSPVKQRAVVEGLKMIKKHVRKSQDYPKGKIIEREGTLHLSNLMLASKYDERAGRRGGAASSAT